MSSENRASRTAGVVRWVSALLIVSSLFVITRRLPLEDMLGEFRDVVNGLGVWGPVVFALTYVAAMIALVPGSLLTLAAGATFGLLLGTAVVSVASTVGFACTFLIARHLARDRVKATVRSSPKLRAIDTAISRGGWKIVAMLRLSPAVPFNLQNYLYGVTGIGFWPAVLASWIAMLPGTFLFVYLGYAGRAGLEAAASDDPERGWGQWLFLGVGLLATLAVTVYITRSARRALREAADEPAAASEPAGPKGFTPGTVAAALVALVLAGAAVATLVGY